MTKKTWKEAMLLAYGDEQGISDHMAAIGSKGGRNRKKPYSHFKYLSENNPQKLKEITSKGGKKK